MSSKDAEGVCTEIGDGKVARVAKLFEALKGEAAFLSDRDVPLWSEEWVPH